MLDGPQVCPVYRAGAFAQVTEEAVAAEAINKEQRFLMSEVRA